MIEFVDRAIDPTQQALGDELFASLFFTSEGTANPLPLYARFHNEVPLHVSGFGGAVLSRYDDCRQILRDGRFGNGDAEPNEAFGGSNEITEYRRDLVQRRNDRARSMLMLDPPDHTRQRKLVSRAFTPRTVDKLRPRIAQLVDSMLDELAETGTADVMEVLAKPLPVTVISEMLGVPVEDWPSIRDYVTDLVLSLEPSASLEDLKSAEAASNALISYFTDLVAHRRNAPQDDLLSGLIAASDHGDMLSEQEILAVAVLLFAAGAETTTNLIGNGVHQLLSNPDQLDRLWADPSLVPSAVEEILRHDSPVQIDGRTCLEAAELFGMRFEPGDRVLTLLGAANHDPDHFEDPDRFDIGRYHGDAQAEPVMSFASGIHYCLGANLARVEGEEVFAGLIRRFAAMSDGGERIYRHRLVLRGLETCPTTFTPR